MPSTITTRGALFCRKRSQSRSPLLTWHPFGKRLTLSRLISFARAGFCAANRHQLRRNSCLKTYTSVVINSNELATSLPLSVHPVGTETEDKGDSHGQSTRN